MNGTMLFDAYQPSCIQKFQLIRNFFEELKNLRQNEIQESARLDESQTQRQAQTQQQIKPRRAIYIQRKEHQKENSMHKQPQVYRPSDIIMIEQHKKTIDQFCRDNAVLYNSLKDCFHVIELMKNKIKELELKNSIDYEQVIEQLKLKIKFKDDNLQQQNKVIKLMREKQEQTIKLITEHSQEYENDWAELNAVNAQLETENVFLRKLLSVQFTDQQILNIQDMQNKAEFNFYDNFCISKKDLDRQAILEYEKLLGQRKDNIEQQYVEWNLAQLNKQPEQINDLEMYGEEKEMMIKKSKPISKEEKNKIMEELLKPIGGAKQSINIQDQKQQFFQEDVKQKQLDLLNTNTTPLKAKNMGNLAIEIDLTKSESQQKVIQIEVDEPSIEQDEQQTFQMNQENQQQQQQKQQQQVKGTSQKKEIMNSLTQGMQKLLSHHQNIAHQNRYQDEEEEDEEDQVLYKEQMFSNQKTIFYDQEDDYEEDDDDEIYQQIIQQQKKQANKPSLSKTQKNQELQYQN